MTHSQVRFAFLPVSGEVVSNTDNQSSIKFQKGPALQNVGLASSIKERTMNVDIDFCGICRLIKALVEADICTILEAKRIARRIAAQTGASIILSMDI